MAGLTAQQLTATGDVEGNVWLWSGSIRQEKPLGSHQGPVTALTAFASLRAGGGPSGVISASGDSLKFWDVQSATLLKEFSIAGLLTKLGRIPEEIPARGHVAARVGGVIGGSVSSISVDAAFRRLLVSLSSGIVFELAHDSEAVVLVSEVSRPFFHLFH